MWERDRGAGLRHEGEDDMKQKEAGQSRSYNATQLRGRRGDVPTHLLQIIYISCYCRVRTFGCIFPTIQAVVGIHIYIYISI